MCILDAMATTSHTCCVLCGVQYVIIIGSAALLIGHLKLAQAVTQCIRCDSMQDSDGRQEADCERNPPSASYCNSQGPAYANYLCMTAREYDGNGNQVRIVRDCTSTLKDRFSCTSNAPENVVIGYPAKSCYWTCNTDACNTASSRSASDPLAVLVIGGLFLATVVCTWVV